MLQTSTSCEEQQHATNDAPHLAPRELEILTLVAQGKTDNEIAIQLCLSAKTVSWYMSQIRSKLDASSRAHAVALAMQQGILSLKPCPDQGP